MSTTKGRQISQSDLRLCRLHEWPTGNGLGFTVDKESGPPFSIELVESNSPAAAGGLKMRDVILAFNGQKMNQCSYLDLSNAIKNGLRSDRVELLVIDKNFYNEFQKDNTPIDPNAAKIMETPRTIPSEYKNFPANTPREITITLKPGETSFGFDLAFGKGNIGTFIRSVHPNTPASKTALRSNDRVLEIDNRFVDKESSNNIKQLINDGKSRANIRLYVVDTATYKYFQQSGIPLESKQFKNSPFFKNLLQNTNSLKPQKPFDINEQKFPTRPTSSILDNLRPTGSASENEQDDIRLCSIYRSSKTDKIGFKLEHIDNDYLVKLMPGVNNGPSNAELAGVKDGDHLIQVNGENIEDYDRDTVTSIIKNTDDTKPVELLVTDADTHAFYRQNDETIHPKLKSVKKMSNRSALRSSQIFPLESTIAKLVNPNPKPDDSAPQIFVNPRDRPPKVNPGPNRRYYELKNTADYDGLGFRISTYPGNLYGHKITEISPNSPAYREGLPTDYYVKSINDQNVLRMPASKLKPFVREQMNVAYESGRPVLVEIIDENTFQEELANAFVPPKPKPDPVITKPAPVIEKPAPEIQEPYTVLRRCFVRAWPNYKDLGFHVNELLTDWNPGKIYKIRGLDPNSPAAHTNIRNGDILIQVNGENVENESHVVVDKFLNDTYRNKQRIELLVINDIGYQWYHDRQYPIDPSSPNVKVTRHETPDPPREYYRPGNTGYGNNVTPGKHGIDCLATDLLSTKSTPQYPSKILNGSSSLRNPYSTIQKLTYPPSSLRKSQDNLSQASIDIVSEKNLYRVCRLNVLPGGSFGFGLSTDHGSHNISNIVPDSPAARGGLKQGDRIIEVDDANVVGQSHQAVTNLIRNASQNGKVRLLIEPYDVKTFKKPSAQSLSVLYEPKLHKPTNFYSANDIPTLLPNIYGERNTNNQLYGSKEQVDEPLMPRDPLPRECVILRDSSFPRCGFRVTQHANFDTPIVIEVNPKSPAQRSGLTKGDHIIYVESKNVQDIPFDKLVDFIKRTYEENGQVTLVALTSQAYHVLKRRGGYLNVDPFSYQSVYAPEMKPRLCRLKLLVDDYDFGFTLQRNGAVYVESIEPGSVADLYGIQIGDIVLELNDQDVKPLSLKKIKEIQEFSKRLRQLDILVIDQRGYEFSITHAIPLNSNLPFVAIKDEPDPQSSFKTGAMYL